MKQISSIALLALAGLCTAGSLQAQSHEVRANVPFDFAVGDKLLPAGSYRFLPQLDSSVLIGNRDQQMLVLARNSEDGKAGESDLVFNKYGSQYFLNGIHCTSIAVNVELPASRLEKRAQHQLAQSSAPSRTLVALR
jgi:hypothetical protein